MSCGLPLLSVGGTERTVHAWIGSGDFEGAQWLEGRGLMCAPLRLWVGGMGRRQSISAPDTPVSREAAWRQSSRYKKVGSLV